MGHKPTLPLWLIHTQVRIIPVANQHNPYCEKMLDYLSSMEIRADLDDRGESVSKKIRESETEWIRYTLVVGDKEIEEEKLIVRDRVLGKQRVMVLKNLVEEIRTQIADRCDISILAYAIKVTVFELPIIFRKLLNIQYQHLNT
jgi:threonyl-tRNA synthetase